MSRAKIQTSEKDIAKELNKLRCSEDAKLIVTFQDEKLIAFLISCGMPVCITVIGGNEVLQSESINLGDIVIAYVKDVKKDIEAAFIEYAKDKDGYLPLNKLPKGLNIRQGDLIPVKLTSTAQKGKRASFTAKIDYSKLPDGDALYEKSKHLTRYSYLYKNTAFIKDKIDKVFKRNEYSEIVTDDENVFEILSGSFSSVRLYDDSFGLAKIYSLRTILDEALERKVWLKSGGYICIDHTEAMTVIDVNSGKFSPAKNTPKESAYLSVNLEAAEEICRQLRLRNISGIVIIDFINLCNEDDKKSLLNVLKAESGKDTQKVNVLDITSLGLVEMTRKKELPPLYEQLK